MTGFFAASSRPSGVSCQTITVGCLLTACGNGIQSPAGHSPMNALPHGAPNRSVWPSHLTLSGEGSEKRNVPCGHVREFLCRTLTAHGSVWALLENPHRARAWAVFILEGCIVVASRFQSHFSHVGMWPSRACGNSKFVLGGKTRERTCARATGEFPRLGFVVVSNQRGSGLL
jgi:hypothetical protein